MWRKVVIERRRLLRGHIEAGQYQHQFVFVVSEFRNLHNLLSQGGRYNDKVP